MMEKTPNDRPVIGKVTVILESASLSTKALENQAGELLNAMAVSDDFNVYIVPADEYPYE
jgi:hypothetical protein